MLGFVIFIAAAAIKSAGKQDLSESVQKIGINHLQVATLAKSFPLRWPVVLRGLFEFQGAISTLGDHLVNPDCVAASRSDAELFYSKQWAFVTVPFITILFSFIFWLSYAYFKGEQFFNKRVKDDDTTSKDKFVVTVGALMYLIYPTLVSNAFKVFDCRRIGDVLYLQVDLEEVCFTGRHMWMVVVLGTPQLLGFVLGLPCLLYLFLKRNHSDLHKHAVLARYGLFFGAFKKDKYYWELIVLTRKIFIVGISVFGPILGPRHQAQLTLIVLLVCIVLEVAGRPFREETPRHAILPKLELSSLLVEWFTMWSGLVIFTSLDEGSTNFVELLTAVVLIVNIIMLLWLVFSLSRECFHENGVIEKVSAMDIRKRINSWGTPRTQTEHVLGADFNTCSVGEVELRSWAHPVNPMYEEKVEEDVPHRPSRVKEEYSVNIRVATARRDRLASIKEKQEKKEKEMEKENVTQKDQR